MSGAAGRATMRRKEDSVPGIVTMPSVSMTISTSLGTLQGTWRPTSVTRAAAILLPGVASPFTDETPLLDDLSARLQQAGVSTLQLDVCPREFYDGLVCLLSALASLRRQGVDRMALIGMGSGASLAIGAGSVCDAVTVCGGSSAEHHCHRVCRRCRAASPATAAWSRLIPSPLSRFPVTSTPARQIPKSWSSSLVSGTTSPCIVRKSLEKLTAWTRGLLRSPFKPHCAHSPSIAEVRAGRARPQA